MIDLLRKDISIGDKLKLYLTTGKEPFGILIEVGEDYIVLESENDKKTRYFDKLIGGWDLLERKAKLNVKKNNTRSDSDNNKDHIDFEELVKIAHRLKNVVSGLDIVVYPNASLIEVRDKTCIASNSEFTRILVFNNGIIDPALIEELENVRQGMIVPVYILYYSKDRDNVIATAVLKPGRIERYIDLLTLSLKERNLAHSKLLCYVLKSCLNRNYKELFELLNRLKKIEAIPIVRNNRRLNINNDEDRNEKTAFKKVEKRINELIRQVKYSDALSEIREELDSNSIESRYKSSLLLKRAQIYSSMNSPEQSEIAYKELIRFNESIASSSNNLSHLYTELARLQAQSFERQSEALKSLRKALNYNPGNNFALNLLRQLEGKSTKIDTTDVQREEHLMIEMDEDSTAISRMIDLDIKEHKYTNAEIIRAGEKATPYIAKAILEQAKKTRAVDLSERYPVYLEAAKAFSDLNVGSYDLQDYLESVAFYSILKANSLFLQFKNIIKRPDRSTKNLIRLKDSACSYYLESINILSTIDPKFLVNIIASYLKLNLAVYYLQKGSIIDYSRLLKGSFSKVFQSCIESSNEEIKEIAFRVIVDFGASSIHAWNNLYNHPNGTKILYDNLRSSDRAQEIYKLINKIEGNRVSLDLKSKEFLKTTFLNRRASVKAFISSLTAVSNIEFEPVNLSLLVSVWGGVDGFEKHLCSTDIELKTEIDGILELVQPYLNRSDRERLNILIQARSVVEKQLKFINDNTTFYGRTFFFSLLSKWKREIDNQLEVKVGQSFPQLEVYIDPPYYIETEKDTTAPLVIRNVGAGTAEGFILNIHCESIVYESEVTIPFESSKEVPSGGRIEMAFVIPKRLLTDAHAVEIQIEIVAIYQRKKLKPLRFEFTVEEEPKSDLTYEDIPWRDGTIPPEHLFKGRKKLIADLSQHYLSIEKDKPYILYGLTRTGKSSILQYLKMNIEGDKFHRKGREILVLTFSWDLSEAASFKKAPDFWNYILYQQTYEVLERYAIKYNLNLSGLKIGEGVRAKDFKIILEFLRSKDLYPIFFVDEFSFIKTLIDDGTINAAFLHTLRQHSLNELASFVFAGTYDIKTLIRDERYGITGQLVNAIEEQVSEISEESAEELIEVIDDKLSFTPEAIDHIKFLSGRVPYFIQIICKYCGYYAAENRRRVIGFPEVEKVIKILIGQNSPSQNSLVKKLPENIFQNNQFSLTDPREVSVLISSIVHFNRDRITDPRGVGFSELQKLWSDTKIRAFMPKLADAINILKEKKIIIQKEDEGIPVYSLSVDLFRRWWSCHHPDINLTLTTLT